MISDTDRFWWLCQGTAFLLRMITTSVVAVPTQFAMSVTLMSQQQW
jgi:hypothetical protein